MRANIMQVVIDYMSAQVDAGADMLQVITYTYV